ncbi:MAG: tape measure protein [Thermodesulfobacteriota bacterium]
MADNKVEIVISAKDQASVPLKKVESSSKSLGSSMGALKQAINGAGTALLGFGAIGIGRNILEGLTQAGIKSQQLNSAFKAITGSSALAGKELEWLRGISEKLGLEFLSIADAYKGISAAAQGTSLAGEQTRKIFKAAAEAATVLGLSAEDTSGILRAFGQMVSKGKVQSEEILQVAERMPGTFKLFAEALGVSGQQLSKLLEQGQVLANDALPKLADVMTRRFGKEAASAAGNASQEINRLVNAWNELKRQVAEGGFLTLVTGVIKQLGEATRFWADQLGRVKQWMEGGGAGSTATASIIEQGSAAIKARIAELEIKLRGRGTGFVGPGTMPHERLEYFFTPEEQSQYDFLKASLPNALLKEYKAMMDRYRLGEISSGGNLPAAISQDVLTKLNPLARPYAREITAASTRYNVLSELIAAVIAAESQGRVTARGTSGEYGLMQIMPSTWAGLTNLPISKALEAEPNIMAGTSYLRQLIDKFGDKNLFRVLTGYNQGPGVAAMENLPADRAAQALNYYQSVMKQMPTGEENLAQKLSAGLKMGYESDLSEILNNIELKTKAIGIQYEQNKISIEDYYASQRKLADETLAAHEKEIAGLKTFAVEESEQMPLGQKLYEQRTKHALAHLNINAQEQSALKERGETERQIKESIAALDNDQLKEALLRIEEQSRTFKEKKIADVLINEWAEKAKADAQLRYSKSGADGARRALKDIADESTNWATQMETVTKDAFKGMEDAFVNFVTTGKLSFEDLANSIIADLARIAVQQSITGPLSSLLGSLFGGSGTSGYGYGGALLGWEHGGAFSNGHIVPFGGGGVIRRPTLFPFAAGIGMMGEAGEEAIMPLTRLPGGDLGVKAQGGGGGGNTYVYVYGAPEGTKVQETTQGNDRFIEVFLNKYISQSIREGAAGRAIEQTYGVSRRGGY